MEPYRTVSFSGGKDSTAMLLRMVELGVPFDELLFCDTTVEFPQMYEHIAKVEEYIGQPITRLTAEHSFEYYLLEYEYIRRSGKRKGELVKGYPFPFVNSRWCTEKFKIETIRRHCKAKAAGRPILQFVGIAADEPKRVRDKVYPLVEWGWTEADCLAYCKKHGFNWGGLYRERRRLSCWCCPLQAMHDWRLLRRDFPSLWARLLDWQSQKELGLTSRFSAFDLERRFALEEEWESQGRSITSREFFEELKRRNKN